MGTVIRKCIGYAQSHHRQSDSCLFLCVLVDADTDTRDVWSVLRNLFPYPDKHTAIFADTEGVVEPCHDDHKEPTIEARGPQQMHHR